MRPRHELARAPRRQARRDQLAHRLERLGRGRRAALGARRRGDHEADLAAFESRRGRRPRRRSRRSDLLVQLRELARDGDAVLRREPGEIGERGREAAGRLEHDARQRGRRSRRRGSARARPRRAAPSRGTRSPRPRGPRRRARSRPRSGRAARSPGSRPRARARRAARPGSAISGMPESETSATGSPASARATSRSATCGSRRSSQATSSGAGIPCALSSARVRRVSSHAITRAAASASSARSVMSRRLPSGVGTTVSTA